MKLSTKFINYCICVILLPIFGKAQTTETFESATVGTNSFTNGSFVGNLSATSGTFLVGTLAGYGYNSSNKFLEATHGNPSSITSTTTFKVSSLYLYPSTDGGSNNQTASVSVTFTGKLNGTTVFTYTPPSSDFTSASYSNATNRGFTLVNFATPGYQNLVIDELVTDIGGSGNYIAIDNFTFTPISTTTWNGSTWSNGTPTLNANAIIAGSSTPGAFTCNNLTINSGQTLLLNSGVTVLVYGNVVNNGSTSGSGKVSIVGSAQATLSGTGTYTNLDVNTSAGVKVGTTASDTLNITGLLSFTSGAITTNNKVVLKSSATGTAMVYGAAGNYTSNGNFFTIERYIPSNNRKKYVFLTAPLSSTSAPSMYASWQENGTTTVGYGTQITGPTGSNLATTGFDAVSSSGLSSAFTYNDANASGSKWVGITNTKTYTWGTGKAVLLFVRGDRTVAPGSNATGNTVLRVTGNIYPGAAGFGNIFFTSGADKYSAFGNLYAAPVDWTLLTKTNLKSTFTVYDPNLGVFVTSDGTTVSPSISQQSAKFIQSGQAFFVQNVATATSGLTFAESHKAINAPTASSNTVFSAEPILPQLNINVYDVNNVFVDGAVAVFDNAYKKGIDTKDADKLENISGETFGLFRNGKMLSIEGRPLTTGNDSIHFSMVNFAKKDYILKIDGNNLSGLGSFKLIDNYAKTQTALDLSVTNSYKYSVTQDAASVSNSRFAIVFSKVVDIANNSNDNNFIVKMSPNPVSNQLLVNFTNNTAKKTYINIVNSLGQLVKTVNVGAVSNGNIGIDVSHLSAGAYSVLIKSGDNVITSQTIVKE